MHDVIIRLHLILTVCTLILDPGAHLRVGGGRGEAGDPADGARRPPRRQPPRLGGRDQAQELGGLLRQGQPQGKERT